MLVEGLDRFVLLLVEDLNQVVICSRAENVRR